MRRINLFRRWSLGRKAMASHLLIALASIVVAVMLCYIFGYQYTCGNAGKELMREAQMIARRESYGLNGRVSRGMAVEIYQEMSNATLFFVRKEGDSVQLQRYILPAPSQLPSEEDEYGSIEILENFEHRFVDRILAGETFAAENRFVLEDEVVIFAGAPITDGSGEVIGGVILAQPIEIMRAISRELGKLLFIAAGISIVLAIILALAQTHRLVRPVKSMTRAARKMAEGDYSHRVIVCSEDEIGELGRTLNTLSLRLMETIESLREERDRLEHVIGSIGEGILAVDRHMQVVHHNMAFLEMMELDSIEEIYHAQRADVVQLMEILQKTVRDGEGQRTALSNPSRRALVAEVTALSVPEAEKVGAVCLLADISEAQRMEQLRRDYVANISHELRTPLTGIRGMIEPLMDGCVESDEERQSCYAIIHNETIRLEKLVTEMLDMSRLQDGRLTVELEEMELSGILLAAVRSMEPLAREAGIELTLETDGSALKCMANENRILQVLVILLDNAIDFTPRGGRITLFAGERDRRHIAVGVRDTGCGIEPRDLPLIWERFYKADRSRMRTKGTGLGLAIAKLVVELLGGEISVRSEPGRGAEFVFTLNRA